MGLHKIEVSAGITWVEAPEANLRVLCGSPADSVKHLMQAGLIAPIEKDGIRYESGPNAILLSDIAIQNGGFSNLAEFPVLQMFYRQGMLIPKHPGNDGTKPLIIGLENQLRAQLQYIDIGKSGIMNELELAKLGLRPKQIADIINLKLAFAYGDTRSVSEQVETICIEREEVELRGGVKLKRIGLNLFRFSLGDETIDVNLNLAVDGIYQPAQNLPFVVIRPEYFSIVHIGEGDGWNPVAPCMGSILTYKGRIYLIDTGPNILATLTALGLSPSDIHGVFQTHAHDDHFAGLPTLARSDHRIKHYSTRLVRASLRKKTCVLMSIPESRFEGYFEAIDLAEGKWNNIDGLEVMPVFSPHPVETCVYYFRVKSDGNYKSYAHLADIISNENLANLIKANSQSLEPTLLKKTMRAYAEPADIKKVDAGGGSIHGSWKDFINDKSKSLYLSHLSSPLPDEALNTGRVANFGDQDILVPGSQDYIMQNAIRYIKAYFPEAKPSSCESLLDSPLIPVKPGEVLQYPDRPMEYVMLLLSGVIELCHDKKMVRNRMPSGTFMGEHSVITSKPSEISYRALSIASCLRIQKSKYLRFIKENYRMDEIIEFHERMLRLKSSYMFGDMMSTAIISGLARKLRKIALHQGERIEPNPDELFMVKNGVLGVFLAEAPVEQLEAGGIFGEEGVLLRSSSITSAVAMDDTELYAIPTKVLEGIPAIEWKLLEIYERRINAFGAFLG